MGRAERIQAAEAWDRAFERELAGTRRRALRSLIRSKPKPTLRDLLVLIGEGVCDLEDTPKAGEVRVGDLVGRDGTGPLVLVLLDRLELDLRDALDSARERGVNVDVALIEFLD